MSAAHPPDAPIIIHNPQFTLHVRLKGGLNPGPLTDRHSGFKYADRAYIYRVGDSIAGRPAYVSHQVQAGQDATEITLVGRLAGVRITHRFRVHAERPHFDEEISLANEGGEPVDGAAGAFGFARSLAGRGQRSGPRLRDSRFISVPFRREPLSGEGEYQDYSIEDLRAGGRYRAFRPGAPQPFPRIATPESGAEGWAWAMPGRCLLVLKHSPRAIEHSILAVEKSPRAGPALRFGGAAVWHGDPEEACRLEPAETFTFGTTRYVFVDGDWKQAYYAFRQAMEEFGHGVPEGFDPPIHWNELYDNPLWWGADTAENRKKFYSLPQIEEEAAKASDMRCEALYLDPGWDTSFASTIWAEDRLLKAGDFVALMRDQYGLAVSLHTPLAAWTDISAYPVECRRKTAEGKVLESLCSGSPDYIRIKSERLVELARAGVVYFMFDGSGYTGACHDPAHGHSPGYSRQEHCLSILAVAQSVHRAFPDVIIELHDPIVAGVPVRYAPVHFLHGLPGSFDEAWALEYMWDPMDDLLSGRAVSLYYYNLAYSLPMYVHIDLRKDNENCLEFWWYASTCRHLGIGGKHTDPKVWQAHKRAMREYTRLKPFFARGRFFGLDENVHVHALEDRGRAVVTAFNLDPRRRRIEASFRTEEIGLPAGADIIVSGAEHRKHGATHALSFSLPARCPATAEILTQPPA